MFKTIGLKNFRTHKDSTIELSDLTLLIGSNNSGKSNFFAGLHYFSRLLSLFNPDRNNINYELRGNNYFSQKHSLSKDDEPIEFSCSWELNETIIKYELSIFPDLENNSNILCKEKLVIGGSTTEEFKHGYLKKSNQLLLRKQIRDSSSNFSGLIFDFFQDLASFYYYNFQPSFLKGEGVPLIFSEGRKIPLRKKDYIKDYRETKRYPNVPSELGKEGTSLQEILMYIKEYEEETYNRFFGYLKRFVKNFNGLIIKDNEIKWQFDMGGSNFPFYEPEKISDGLVKAAAVALLCSLKRPPALILLEEVENGINQKKLSEFLSWLTHASDKSTKTQFVLSSHSPSVIREFSDKLDTVYNIHLRERDFVSRITNLNEAIKPLVNMGTIQEESTITKNGKEVIQIRPYHLIELFFNGVLGEL
ncbi:MAG: ATP-binding protein [Chitinophagaceae bacterium]|jgi:AAA15 family ATPase/GTPase